MRFCFFVQTQNEIKDCFEKLALQFKAHGHCIKYVQCNNGGEYEKQAQDASNTAGTLMGFTTTEMPQFNSATEQHFETLKRKSMAMMNLASFNPVT